MTSSPLITGVVEGFYGRPWSAAQRREIIGRLRTLGLNTYLYAPKDDLRHRTRWREAYQTGETSELRALIATCRDAGIDFVYAVAPGLDRDFSTPGGHAALARKVDHLAELGARHFAVLFDDIIPAPASGNLGATEHDAAPQVAFAHRLLAFQHRLDPDTRLLFCPTPYCGRMAGNPGASGYLRHVGDHLDPAVQVMCTGPEIVSESITPEDLHGLTSVLRRKPLIWDNLFANDYDLRRLHLGPYAGRPSSLRAAVSGVLLNPNCEFDVNRPGLETFAEWCMGADYESAAAHARSRASWRPAWRCLGPGGSAEPLPADLLELLCDCLHLPFSHGPKAEAWRSDLRAALGGDAEAASRARAGGAALGRLFEHLTRLEDRELLHTVYRHVWELKEEAGLLLGYLDWLESRQEGNEAFFSAEHRSGTYRGGFAADLQRLLTMRADGSFTHQTSP